MFVYEKKLQYPIKIKNTNPKLAKIIISQYGGLYCKKILCLCIKINLNVSGRAVEDYALDY